MECIEKHSKEKLTKTQSTLATVGDIIVLLCGFNAAVSFIEACFWHLTEPSALGFRLMPVVTLVTCLVAPSALSFNQYLTRLKFQHKYQLLWSLVEPALLFVSSLPCLDERASYRTVVLGVATFLLPSVVRYKGSIVEGNAAVKVSVVLYISLCVRWASHSINIFYEEWHLPAALLILNVIILTAEVSLLKTFSEKIEISSSRNSSFEAEKLVKVRSITIQTDLSMESQEEKVSAHSKDTCDTKSLNKNDRATESSLSVSSGYNSEDKTSSLYEKSQYDESTFQNFDVKKNTGTSFLMIVLPPGIASNIIFFCQFSSSPYQLLRWSGFERSSSNAIFVLAFFTLTTLFVLFSDCTPRKLKVLKTDEENQTKTFINVSFYIKLCKPLL